MEYRTHDGVELSEIGVGLYALTGVYGKKDEQRFRKMLMKAYEEGVTFFDTAEAYGNAESVLGETVHSYRDDVVIATKVGMREGVEPNLSESSVRNACEDSLKRLNTDYIDLYQVHFDDPKTPVEETIGVLDDLIAEGKIRHYGVGHLPREKVEKYCKKGAIFSVLMELSAVSRRSLTTLLPLCRAHEAGGIAFSATGRGILTGRFNKTAHFEPGDIRNIDPLFQREHFESALRITDACRRIAKHHEKSTVQVALGWVLQQPGIICALTGPSSDSHLQENCGASGWSLSREDMRELETLFKREDAWMKVQQLHTIESILSEPLPTDLRKAFRDLLYVLETSVTAELTSEQEIMPLFHDLFSARKNEDHDLLAVLQETLTDVVGSSSDSTHHS